MNGFSSQYKYQQAQQAALASSIHVAALVKVISFDAANMRVNVKPIAQRNTSGDYAGPSQILDVPVAGTRGGGFIFRPVYKSGDIGIVVYLDHDIDTPLEKGDECAPNTERTHSDSDAVFLGGVVAGGWTSSGLPDGLVLATENGSVSLAVTTSGISIKGTVTVEGDVVADGISLKSHTHSGVSAGGDITGAPQ